MRPLAAILAALAVACGPSAGAGDGEGPDPADAHPGGGDPIDSGSGGGGADGGELNSCLPQVPGSYGIPTPVDSSQFQGNEGTYTDYYVSIDLVDGPFQRVSVVLHSDQGLFDGGPVETGTYTIEGDEADYSWCSVCVYLSVDDGDTPSTQYMARTGKVEIDSVGAEVHGEISSIELRQIEHVTSGGPCQDAEENWLCGNNYCSDDQCAVQDENEDCETAIASLSF